MNAGRAGKKDSRVVELLDEAQWRAAFPVMRELRTHLSLDEFLSRVRAGRENGYRLFALMRGERVVALAGLAIWNNTSIGRYVWVYDLVTAADQRSTGAGQELLEFVEEFARREKCAAVELASGHFRVDAHRFYETRMGYENFGFVFSKRL